MSSKKGIVKVPQAEPPKKGLERLLGEVTASVEAKIMGEVKTEMTHRLSDLVKGETDWIHRNHGALDKRLANLTKDVEEIVRTQINGIVAGRVETEVKRMWGSYINGEIEKAFAERKDAFIIEAAKQIKQIQG